MQKVKMLTLEGCSHCAEAKVFFKEENIEYEEVDATSDEGMKLISEHNIMTAPGIFIDGELFSTGGIDKKKFLKKLKT